MHIWRPTLRTVLDNLRGRNFEPEAPLLPRLLRPESICLHVGASNGRHTYLMAKAARRGRVHAFEPSRDTFPVLETAMRLHGLRNVSCHNVAVSDAPGTVQLSVPFKLNGEPGHSFGYTRIDDTRQRRDLRFKGENRYLVDAVTLDGFVAEKRLADVDLVRIDAEGAEAKVIPGARHLFERFRPNALIEFHPPVLRDLFDTEAQDLLGFFLRLDYACFYLQDGKLTRTERIIEERFRDYFLLHPSRGDVPPAW
jgi:FkbM family methyltransferase